MQRKYFQTFQLDSASACEMLLSTCTVTGRGKPATYKLWPKAAYTLVTCQGTFIWLYYGLQLLQYSIQNTFVIGGRSQPALMQSTSVILRSLLTGAPKLFSGY